MDRPKLGEWRSLVGKVCKTREGVRADFNVTFKREAMTLTEGVYIGWRVVHEGNAYQDNEYGDYGTLLSSAKVFDRKRSFVVWLFAIDERKKPIMVLPTDVFETIPF